MLANSPRVARPIGGLAHGLLPETNTEITKLRVRNVLTYYYKCQRLTNGTIVISHMLRICALTFQQDVHTFGAPQVFHRANGPRARRSVAPSARMRAA
jgi:hypothetical protein